MNAMTPEILFHIGPLVITDTVPTTLLISLLLVLVGLVAVRRRGGRELLEALYEMLEAFVQDTVTVDARPVVPLILTLWAFIVLANLAGLVPGLASPTRDLSLTAALAVVSFGAGHVYGFQAQGWRYVKHYIEPNPLMLPFNIVGEASRTLALALRLFGNIASGELVIGIIVSLAGLLLPLPLMLLSVLTSVVQAYIFGVLTLVFTASAMQVAVEHTAPPPAQEPTP